MRKGVESAIEYFKDAVRETDEIIAGCSPAMQAELIEQKQHYIVALAALEQQAMDWISVKDRLPEKGTLVLLFLEKKEGNKSVMTTGKIYASNDAMFDGEYCIGFNEMYPEFLVRKYVTHWMPLPEPPKETEPNTDICGTTKLLCSCYQPCCGSRLPEPPAEAQK